MENDLMLLQQQAARRVQQMQDHARRVFTEREGKPPHRVTPTAPPAPAPRLYNRPPPATTEDGLFSLLSHLETEQWMLLGLALLLFRCGGHTELTLALLYLAL